MIFSDPPSTPPFTLDRTSLRLLTLPFAEASVMPSTFFFFWSCRAFRPRHTLCIFVAACFSSSSLLAYASSLPLTPPAAAAALRVRARFRQNAFCTTAAASSSRACALRSFVDRRGAAAQAENLKRTF
jgi:hypothetical protein